MSDEYDVAVIGAGIHGAGAAQAAAAAGYRVLVLEQQALAAGTSGKSSKLIHGGLRYLESGHWRLVRESLRERELLLRLAPELVRLVPFLIPIYGRGTRRPWQIRAGLSLYALLGGLKATSRFQTVPRKAWADLDGINTHGLQAVFRYFDGQTDDVALVRAVMRSAESLGAELICPARFVAAAGDADGFSIDYQTSARAHTARARVLINATGPWANEVLGKIDPRPATLPIELAQGAHIVLDARLQSGIYYVEARRDRRAVFAMPWQGRTLVGTTETPFYGEPRAAHALPEEIAYLLETWRYYFPTHTAAVMDSFAGVRVLERGSSSLFHRSRATVLYPDARARPRVMTIYGGKLTAYRATAARVLHLLKPALPSRQPIADTAELPLDRG